MRTDVPQPASQTQRATSEAEERVKNGLANLSSSHSKELKRREDERKEALAAEDRRKATETKQTR